MCRSVNMRGFAMATAVANLLDHLRNDAGLQGKDIANVMAVSPATVSRWMSGKASPDLKTQLIMSDLRFVADRLAEFYQPDETRLWLHAPHAMLNGERAVDLIHRGETERVLAVIEAIGQGAYV